MPRQRTHYSRRTYVFPDNFPQRLKRFQEESGLSWSEIARRLETYRHTVWRWAEGRARPNHQHRKALVELDFSPPGKPTDNAMIEVFNARLRADCLNES